MDVKVQVFGFWAWSWHSTAKQQGSTKSGFFLAGKRAGRRSFVSFLRGEGRPEKRPIFACVYAAVRDESREQPSRVETSSIFRGDDAWFVN